MPSMASCSEPSSGVAQSLHTETRSTNSAGERTRLRWGQARFGQYFTGGSLVAGIRRDNGAARPRPAPRACDRRRVRAAR